MTICEQCGRAKGSLASCDACHAQFVRELEEATMTTTRGDREIDDYLGVCPTCRKTDGYRNVGASHWFFCRTHRVRWHVGSNLFSSWHHESEADWEANWQEIGAYREIAEFHNGDEFAEEDGGARPH